MRKSVYKSLIFFVFLSVLILNTLSSYALQFKQQGDVLTNGGDTYYLNENGGVKAYIAYQTSLSPHNKNTLGRAFLTPGKLPGAQGGYGSQAGSAAFRYSGYESMHSGAQYLVKIASIDGTERYGSWTNKSLWDIGETNYVNFRYAGMGITSPEKSEKGQFTDVLAATNPNFPSDWIKASNMGGAQQTAQVYTTNKQSPTSVPVWGTGGDVYDLSLFYANGMGQIAGGNGKTSPYSSSGNIKSDM